MTEKDPEECELFNKLSQQYYRCNYSDNCYGRKMNIKLLAEDVRRKSQPNSKLNSTPSKSSTKE